MLASVVNFFNPSLVVIGGGVAQSGDLLLAAIRETVYRAVAAARDAGPAHPALVAGRARRASSARRRWSSTSCSRASRSRAGRARASRRGCPRSSSPRRADRVVAGVAGRSRSSTSGGRSRRSTRRRWPTSWRASTRSTRSPSAAPGSCGASRATAATTRTTRSPRRSAVHRQPVGLGVARGPPRVHLPVRPPAGVRAPVRVVRAPRRAEHGDLVAAGRDDPGHPSRRCAACTSSSAQGPTPEAFTFEQSFPPPG